jgi:hypothetical protein
MVVSLTVACMTGSATAAGPPQTIATAGRVVAISADGGRVATKVATTSGGRSCNEVSVWQPVGNHLTQIGTSACKAPGDTNQSFDALTLAGGRLAWVDYSYGNHAYCTGMFTATLARPKPVDLGICDGTRADTYYDVAGSGALLVTREFRQCQDSCAPSYNGTYQDFISLYHVTGKLNKIGPLKRDTHLLDVDAGRLLLANGKTLEVVTPNQGKNAVFVTSPTVFNRALLSGNDVLRVTGTNLTAYDATSGQQTVTRSLPAGSKVADFAQGIVVYTNRQSVRLLRVADGRDRVLATVPGLTDAKLDSSGLFYAYNVPKGGSKPGRIAFVSFSVMTQLLG